MGPFWPMTFVFKLHRTGTGKPRLCLGSGFSGNVGRDAGTLLAASGRFGSCLRDRGYCSCRLQLQYAQRPSASGAQLHRRNGVRLSAGNWAPER